MKRKSMNLDLSILLFVVGAVLFMLLTQGCSLAGDVVVRYDPEAAPVDENYHTVLMEVDCGDGELIPGYGGLGCSWSEEQAVTGQLIIHTPLPGSIRLFNEACQIDETRFHPQTGGSFKWDLGSLPFAEGLTTCYVKVYAEWQLPNGKTTEHKLRGMTGRLLLRRRKPGREPGAMEWYPKLGLGGQRLGVIFGQFREFPLQPTPVPLPTPIPVNGAGKPFPQTGALQLNLLLPRKGEGVFRLKGCGQGVDESHFKGDTIVVSKAELVGVNPLKGSCVKFGYVRGEYEDGEEFDFDLVVGIEIFGIKVAKLGGHVEVKQNEICYVCDDAISVIVMNYDDTNDISFKLEHCFDRPETDPRLGFATHKGRSVYGVVDGMEVEYIQ